MQSAAAGSSFPMEALEAAQDFQEFRIHWTWPVPFPPNPSVMAMMISQNGGAKGAKKCLDCGKGCPRQQKCNCQWVTTGFVTCEIRNNGGCTSSNACSSGSIGFGEGDVLIE
jgi:hypothetical protein